MRASLVASAVGLALTLSLSGCSDDPSGSPQSSTTPATPSTPATAAGPDLDTLLAPFGLEGTSGREIVDGLEAHPKARPLVIGASVREDHLVVTDGDVETTVPLPEDLFYVSVAPFVTSTHDCFYHALGGCQGELPDEQVAVRITDGDGTVLVEDVVTTQANGFAGFWLPRDVEGGSIVMTTSAGSGSVPLSTTPGSPTCLTTLQLTSR